MAPSLLAASAARISVPQSHPTQLHSARAYSTLLPPRLIYADFNGDDQPDQVEIYSHGRDKGIELTLSGSLVTQLHFRTDSFDQGSLLCGDIDRDSDEDLVWVSESLPGSVAVWLGDGKGNFEAVQETQPFAAGISSLLGLNADCGIADETNHPESNDAASTSDGPDPAVASRECPGQFSTTVIAAWGKGGIPAIILSSPCERGPPASLSC
ncbi:MAG TPA: VCBS repeat-containing protein [Blastocatellia bacterium]|nr:VCBS repeat-containing protein [Blastocatellia bacterium]